MKVLSTIGAGAGVIIIGLLVLSHYSPLPCTVGLSSTSLNITAEGWGAANACATMMGPNSSGLTPYRTQPFGEVVCVQPVGSVTYTVRDTGLFKIYGNAACSKISSAESGTDIPASP